jgi:nicotinate-nucleotide--dimethylbenzimidazole phosphoribosyltransferase
VFAADHGVVDEGVSAWPRDVTAAMVANFDAGGAAVNVLAHAADVGVIVVDVGVATELPPTSATVRRHRIRPGTGNLAREAAMTVDEARCALDVGATMAAELVTGGNRALLAGDMGIGNTTSAAALISTCTGLASEPLVGRGAGVDDDGLARKRAIVRAAVERANQLDDPIAVLAEIGGLEIAALVGYLIGGAAARVPVVLDGVIVCAAAVVAQQLAPESVGYFIASHRSVEPAAGAALEALGLDPVLDLELRLGEGTGACLALPILDASARLLTEMATFDDASVPGAE